MSETALGRLVSLISDPAPDAEFVVAAEMVEAAQGRLIAGVKVDVDGVGTAFCDGDVIFGKLRPYLAKVWRATKSGSAIGDLHVYRPRAGVNPDFLAYALLSDKFISPVAASTFGTKMPRASWDFIKTVPIWIPPLAEQLRIADFLDRETAKIDTLIEKQNALIERLRERRREVVSHAVRLGIEPRAPMKECGVPWIGMLPSHWNTPQLRRLVTMTSGVGFPVDEQGIDDELHPFYKVNALARADLDGVIRQKYDTISGATAEQLGATIVPAGSLVLAKIGAALLLGRIRVLSFASCIDNNMLAVSPRHGVASRFLYYALQDVRMDLLVNPGAVPSLSEKWFRAYQIPLPPWGEQQEIADYLDHETAKIDSLIVKAERFVELARERRAALITAGVTGQIDIEEGAA